ncbi:DUF1254 domain-containing protein [Rhodopseudomonas sp. BR0G17]|uniref:DUF1254 domain-containing protein n=1 Tax=Rhodopseudomonas sp. BR0G17 TaxID=2269368 RepID=UPI0013E028E8|nr:DUF1254 domain-containing protein [Rhodopseudomonas sp. BR0G17]
MMSYSSIVGRKIRLKIAAAIIAAAVPWGACAQTSTVAPSSSPAGAGFRFGYPTSETSTALYDELDYQRAVQAYIWATPLVNSVGVAKALESAGLNLAVPAMVVFDKPLSPKQVFMTGNDVSTYGNSVIDLSKTGPFVVDAPTGVLGGIVDFWQRAVLDIGVGDTRNGAKLLLLPPGYDGPIPTGYIEVRCRTNRVFLLARGTPKAGEGPDTLVNLLGSIGLYPLAQKDAAQPTRVIRVGGVPMNSDWPKDYRFFEYLADGLSDVRVEPQDKLMYAMLKPLGLEPGKSFQPNERQRRILLKAADTGAAMMANMAFANRFDGRRYWPDREWEKITFATTPDFETVERTELDERAQGWYQLAMNARYLYTMKPVPGEGTWYASTFRDSTGAFLHGGNSYRLHVDADTPAKAFWSVTIYDNRTRSMIDTDQQRAGRGGLSDLKKNADGSVDLYFGPKAPAGMETNWIETIPGQGFFAMFRLYGPLEPAFDGSWKLNDIAVARQ